MIEMRNNWLVIVYEPYNILWLISGFFFFPFYFMKILDTSTCTCNYCGFLPFNVHEMFC